MPEHIIICIIAQEFKYQNIKHDKVTETVFFQAKKKNDWRELTSPEKK